MRRSRGEDSIGDREGAGGLLTYTLHPISPAVFVGEETEAAGGEVHSSGTQRQSRDWVCLQSLHSHLQPDSVTAGLSENLLLWTVSNLAYRVGGQASRDLAFWHHHPSAYPSLELAGSGRSISACWVNRWGRGQLTQGECTHTVFQSLSGGSHTESLGCGPRSREEQGACWALWGTCHLLPTTAPSRPAAA